MNPERKGIISAGNWVVDSVKFIDVLPEKGNLTTIRRVEEGGGGCSHNVLLDLAALKCGLPLYAGGCIGNDDHGKMLLDELEVSGIDHSNMKILDGEATSYTDVMTEPGGARTFFHNRGANARLSVEDVLSCKTDAKKFHLGYLLLLDELDKDDPDYGIVAARVLDGLLKMGYKTSVDVVSEQGDRFQHVVKPCLKYTDYLIFNEVEAGACLGRDLRKADGTIDPEDVASAAAELMACGIRELVLIHFPEGGYALSKDGTGCYADSFSPPKSEIVSTVGAGDAFCAGALYAIHEGYSLRDTLDFANASARFNLFNPTSTGGAPEIGTIQEFLKTR